jgi:hypothetical protein
MQKTTDKARGFTFRFGQRVRVRPPHPDAGATGCVTNAYLFRTGREEVFVAIPGGRGSYEADQLEPAFANSRADASPRAAPGQAPSGGGGGSRGWPAAFSIGESDV